MSNPAQRKLTRELSERIGREPAGVWLDVIVAEFALRWRWDEIDGVKVLCGPEEIMGGIGRFPMWYPRINLRFGLPKSSADHNLCFAALAALKRNFSWSAGGNDPYAKTSGYHVYLTRIGADGDFWAGSDMESLSLAAARAIAKCAIDNGVEVIDA